MSLDSWKAEYYPVPARECAPGESVAHSLKKWRGLTPESLMQNNVGIIDRYILVQNKGQGSLKIDSDTCALCVNFYDDDAEDGRDFNPCESCPIYELLGRPCAEEYGKFLDNGNPYPMIRILEKTVETP